MWSGYAARTCLIRSIFSIHSQHRHIPTQRGWHEGLPFSRSEQDASSYEPRYALQIPEVVCHPSACDAVEFPFPNAHARTARHRFTNVSRTHSTARAPSHRPTRVPHGQSLTFFPGETVRVKSHEGVSSPRFYECLDVHARAALCISTLRHRACHIH